MKYLNLWSLIGLSVRSDKLVFDCAAIATAVANTASEDIRCDDREMSSLSLCIDFAFQSIYRRQSDIRRMWRVSDAPFAGDSRRFRVTVLRSEDERHRRYSHCDNHFIWPLFHLGISLYFRRVDFIELFRFVFVTGELHYSVFLRSVCVKLLPNFRQSNK